MKRSMSEFLARNDDDVENNSAVNQKAKRDVSVVVVSILYRIVRWCVKAQKQQVDVVYYCSYDFFMTRKTD